jgi:hypothetical protein
LARKTEAAPSAPHKGFSAADLVSALNQSIIIFPAGSAEIPAMSKSLLQHAAAAVTEE